LEYDLVGQVIPESTANDPTRYRQHRPSQKHNNRAGNSHEVESIDQDENWVVAVAWFLVHRALASLEKEAPHPHPNHNMRGR